MQQISSDDDFLDGRVRACGMCKYYFLATRRRGVRGRVHASYFPTCAEAREWAEMAQAGASSFTLLEMPALFFHVDDGSGRAQRSEGLLVTEAASWKPMARFGAAAVEDLSVGSVLGQFDRSDGSVLRFRTSIDMPALVRPLRAWRSRTSRSRKPTRSLDWRVENDAVAIDTSHIESLCMRFAQQIRGLRRWPSGSRP